MSEIEGPDGTIYEFPDDTPDETIKSVMAKLFSPSQPAAAPASSGAAGAMDTGRSFMGSMLGGMPVIGPAALGGAQSLAAALHSMAGEGTYDEALKKLQADEPAVQAAHPYASAAGGVTGAVAGTAPLMAAAPAAFGMGTGGLVGRSLASGATGAGIGAADAAARNGLDPGAIASGAVVGGALGTAAPPVGSLLGSAGGALIRGMKGGVTPAQRASSAAGRLAGRALTSDAYDHMTAGMRLNEMGEQGMFADLGPNLTQHAGGLAAIPGKGQKVVRDAMEQRAKGATDRVGGYLEQGFGKGPVNVAQKAQDIISQRGATAKTLYAKAYANPVAWDNRLQQFIDDPVMKPALKKGIEIQRLEALADDVPFNPNDYAITGFNVAGDPIIEGVPNMRTLDVMKKGLDKLIEEQTDAVTGKVNQQGRAFTLVKKAFVRKLDDINPDYQVARREYEGPTKVHAALLEGQEVFNRSMSPDELQMHMAGMNASEREAYVEGARSQIAQMMGTARNDATAATRELSDKGWNREKLSILLGDKPAERLVQGLGLEKTFQGTAQRILHNSETAARQAAQQELGFRPSSFGIKEGLMAGGFSGAVRSAGVKGLEGIANSMRGASKDAVRERLAKMLVATGADRDAALREIGKALSANEMIDRGEAYSKLAAALAGQSGSQTYRSR